MVVNVLCHIIFHHSDKKIGKEEKRDGRGRMEGKRMQRLKEK